MTATVATSTTQHQSVPVAVRVQRVMSKALIVLAQTPLGMARPISAFKNHTNKPDWGDFYNGGGQWGDRR